MSYSIESRAQRKAGRVVGFFGIDVLFSRTVEAANPFNNQPLLGRLQRLECPAEGVRLGLGLLATRILKA